MEVLDKGRRGLPAAVACADNIDNVVLNGVLGSRSVHTGQPFASDSERHAGVAHHLESVFERLDSVCLAIEKLEDGARSEAAAMHVVVPLAREAMNAPHLLTAVRMPPKKRPRQGAAAAEDSDGDTAMAGGEASASASASASEDLDGAACAARDVQIDAVSKAFAKRLVGSRRRMAEKSRMALAASAEVLQALEEAAAADELLSQGPA